MRALMASAMLVVAGCATYGPSEADLRYEFQMSAMEDEQLSDIDRRAANALRDRQALAKSYADYCVNVAVPAVDSCNRLFGYFAQWDQVIYDCARQRREIEFRRIERQHLAQEKDVMANEQRRRDIAEVFRSGSKPQVTCRTERWGKDFRTTCD